MATGDRRTVVHHGSVVPVMGRARGWFPNGEHDMEREHAVRAQIRRLKDEIAEKGRQLGHAQRTYRWLQKHRRAQHGRDSAA